jgi:hypothetical protein
MLAICRKIANDLNCTIPDLVVDDMPKHVSAFYTPALGTLTVSYDVFNSDLATLTAVLAHEMRHHWQHTTRALEAIGPNRIRWQNDIYYSFSGTVMLMKKEEVVPYHKLPWEVDANNYAADYCTRLAKKETKAC